MGKAMVGQAGGFWTILWRSPIANPRPFRKPAVGRKETIVLHLKKQTEKVVSF